MRIIEINPKYDFDFSSFTIEYCGQIWDKECAVTDDRSETPPAKCSKHKAGADLGSVVI